MDFALVGGREFTLQQDRDHEFLASVLGGTQLKASATTFPGASITVVTVVVVAPPRTWTKMATRRCTRTARRRRSPGHTLREIVAA